MPGSVQIMKRTTATFAGTVTLHDLRAFMQACEALSGDERVLIEHHTSRDQRDPSTTTITVHGAA